MIISRYLKHHLIIHPDRSLLSYKKSRSHPCFQILDRTILKGSNAISSQHLLCKVKRKVPTKRQIGLSQGKHTNLAPMVFSVKCNANHWYRFGKYSCLFLRPPTGEVVSICVTKITAASKSKLGDLIHAVRAASFLSSIARSLACTQFSSNLTSHVSLLSTVHIHSPRRVREARVVAVAIAAADVVTLL